MILRFILLLFLGTSLLFACQSPQKHFKVDVIPKPRVLEQALGSFQLDKNTSLFFAEELKSAEPYFISEIQKCTGLSLYLAEDIDVENTISIKLADVTSENYCLKISENSIEIEASDNGGVVYGLQTLKQLIAINNLEAGSIINLPAISIEDGPEFGWRGYMLDVSRHFHSVNEIKQVLDFMAGIKLNRFHWHLSDDQGFRLEMKKYPKLNEIGSWRVDHNTTDESINAAWGRPPQKVGEKATYGGYYTRKQVREIIAYAKERNIEILPEIDVPGHSRAIIASYPELACVSKKYYVATGAIREDNALCPSNPFTYEFMEAVLSEVAELFPFEYIHIGGDECNKSAWENHEQCQALIKKNNLKDEHGLQSYFIRELEKIVNANGKKLIGWDEILEGGLAPNATVMSWRGEKGGIASAKMGHDVIMSPSTYNYLDFKQGQSDFEPNLGYARTLLSNCYNAKVVPDVLSADEIKYIKGTQANLWSESISDWGKLTYMTFPRLFAVAENAWTPESEQNWDDFIERLKPQLNVMENQGVRFAKSVFNPWLYHKGNGQLIKVWFTSELSNPEIRFTLDGTDPTSQSVLFVDTISIEKTTVLKAAIFEKGKQLGNTIEKEFPVHKAAGAHVQLISDFDEKDANVTAMTDLCYGQLLEWGDNNWQQFNNDVEFELTFENPTLVNSVVINSLRHTLHGLYAVSQIEVFAAENNQFKKIGDSGVLKENSIQGRNKLSNLVKCEPTETTMIRVKVHKVSVIPDGHVKAGKEAFMKLDEIIVL